MEYSLTAKGEALVPLIEDMRTYGREWLGSSRSTAARPSAPRRPPSPPPSDLPPAGTPARGGESAGMRNRALHDALRDFALESAAFLSDELRDGRGARVRRRRRGHGAARRSTATSRARPPSSDARWDGLRELPGCAKAAAELGAGAAPWLRVNGLRGEQAEPALRAMLDRLYEDATSFGFPEERFERALRGGRDHALPRRRAARAWSRRWRA